MTLSRQLGLLLILLVALLFAGTLGISVYNSRVYLESQLASHAQDAATSLGLSATSHVDGGDQAMVTAMVNAMFHGGHYLEIRFEDLQGEAWLERSLELQLDDVPPWFQRMFPLHPPQRSATMMSGWRQVGNVVVISHPGLAYRQLWQTAEQMSRLYAMAALFAVLAGVAGLRLLLRPLRDVEAQAAAICEREFPIVDKRPYALELRRVVEAMNRLSARVSRMLDDAENHAAELRRQAYQDPVTGLANRRQFMEILEHRAADAEMLHGGGLLMLQLRNFKAFNQDRGYQAGDRLLREAGAAIATALEQQPRATVAHLAGADFAVLIENVDDNALRTLAEQVADAVAALYRPLDLPSADVAHIGGAVYCGQQASRLLAEADMALRDAQRSAANAVVIKRCALSGEPVRSGQGWRKLIEDALETRGFSLARQPVVSRGDRSLLHHEVFLRIPDPDAPGQLVAGAMLMPAAESSGLAPVLDRAVVEAVIADMQSNAYPGAVAVNLSPASLVDDRMLAWIRDLVADRPVAHGRLILELPEYGAVSRLDHLAAWVEALKPYAVRFSLDHFGRGFASFAYLRGGLIDYLKIDGSFVRGLGQHEDNRFFLRTLADIAHGLDMQVIAESVESEEDWAMLQTLGVDGGRGFWLGRPE